MRADLTHPLDWIRIIVRHKTKVLLWSGFVIAVAIAILFGWPRTYESEAKLFLRLGRESVTLDPTATTGTTVQVQESRENQVTSTRDMLKSRDLLEAVAAKLGPEVILSGPSTDDGESAFASWLSRLRQSITFMPAVSRSEQAIAKLAKSIDITLGRNSSVINIHCTAKTPELARDILESFLEAYREQHLAANRTAGSLEFFAAQTADLKRQLDDGVAKLRDTKSEFNISSMAAEQQALQSQLTQVQAAELAADCSLVSSEASVASLRKSLGELPEQLTTERTTGFPNTAADNMRQEFFKQEIATRELEARLGDDHPLVKTAREQARRLEKVLEAQPSDRSQATTRVNTSWQALDLDLRREEALAQSLRAKAGLLKEQYSQLQQRLRSLNEQEVRVSELERQVAITEANYHTYADHLEQARIGDALEANRISNVNIVQAASLIEKPISPRPTLVLSLALLAAVFGSLGLAFGSEYLDNSLKAQADIESQLGVPVLGAIPRARSGHAVVNH